MNRIIYSSDTQDALLKSNGPYRINSTDDSFSGVKMPIKVEIGKVQIVGEKKLFGNKY